jgi:thiopeptide-type bacteriocin biosynthesis protein
VVRNATSSGIATTWFYVRYNDGGSHLRLRIFGDSKRLWTEVLPDLHGHLAPFYASSCVRKLELGSYEREIERYGGPVGIGLAEEIFCADSQACVELLSVLNGAEGPDDRWLLVVLAWDALLSDLGFDLAARHRLTKESARRMVEEYRMTVELSRALGQKVRAHARDLESILDARRTPDDALRASAREVLDRRGALLRPIAARLEVARAQGTVHVPSDELAWTLMHMHANRMFASAARAQELVLHELLARYYRGSLSRLPGRSFVPHRPDAMKK